MNRALFTDPARTNDEIREVRGRHYVLSREDNPGDPWAVPFDARETPTVHPIIAIVIIALVFATLLIGAVS